MFMLHSRQLLVFALLIVSLTLTGCADIAGAVIDGLLGTDDKPQSDTQQQPTITSIKMRSTSSIQAGQAPK
jgi:predicted small secreted protein